MNSVKIHGIIQFCLLQKNYCSQNGNHPYNVEKMVIIKLQKFTQIKVQT